MPYPVQTVGAAEELLDQLVVSQAGDVGGAHGDLRLTSNCYGFVSGGERLLSHRCSLLLQKMSKDVVLTTKNTLEQI